MPGRYMGRAPNDRRSAAGVARRRQEDATHPRLHRPSSSSDDFAKLSGSARSGRRTGEGTVIRDLGTVISPITVHCPPITRMSRRLKLIIAYDGAPFAGWQSQSHLNTIQDQLERAFERVLGKPVRIHGAGRTDAGVHALAQCAHVDLPNDRL